MIRTFPSRHNYLQAFSEIYRQNWKSKPPPVINWKSYKFLSAFCHSSPLSPYTKISFVTVLNRTQSFSQFHSFPTGKLGPYVASNPGGALTVDYRSDQAQQSPIRMIIDRHILTQLSTIISEKVPNEESFSFFKPTETPRRVCWLRMCFFPLCHSLSPIPHHTMPINGDPTWTHGFSSLSFSWRLCIRA